MVIDVETACSRTSSICQIGIVGFRNGKEVLTYETLVDPRDEFHDFNTRIHGIASHHVRGKPHFGSLHQTIDLHLAGRITVAHSNFDKGALGAACEVHRKPEIATRWLDSVRVARHAWPELHSHKLNVLAKHLDLEHRHHDALSDARAAGMVIVKAIDHTGIELEGWFGNLNKRPSPASASIRRSASGAGPLAGHSVTFTGDFSVPRNQLADAVCAAGGAVTTGPTKKTTLFVMGVQDPSSFAGKAKSSKHLKAEELMSAGQPLRIIDEAQLRSMMGDVAA